MQSKKWNWKKEIKNIEWMLFFYQIDYFYFIKIKHINILNF